MRQAFFLFCFSLVLIIICGITYGITLTILNNFNFNFNLTLTIIPIPISSLILLLLAKLISLTPLKRLYHAITKKYCTQSIYHSSNDYELKLIPVWRRLGQPYYWLFFHTYFYIYEVKRGKNNFTLYSNMEINNEDINKGFIYNYNKNILFYIKEAHE